MWSWLSKIDPNLVIGAVVSVALFIYHQVVPKPAESAVDHVVATVKAVLITAVKLEAPGKTPAQLEEMLRGFAAVQLAKLGYTADKIPPLIAAAVDAAVHEAIVVYVSGPS